MIFLRAIRCLHAPLLALFALAQLAGIIPLIYQHTLNLYETAPVAAHEHAHAQPTAANPDADHHHGALDLHDQCCALHTLAGPLPQPMEHAAVEPLSVRIAVDELIAVAGGKPSVLDRPPRPLPLS